MYRHLQHTYVGKKNFRVYMDPWYLRLDFVDVDKFCVLYVCREAESSENNLKDMLQQLNSIIAAKPSEKAVISQGEFRLRKWNPVLMLMQNTNKLILFFIFPEEAEDPACIPIFWISKWVDYSDKYGLGKTKKYSTSSWTWNWNSVKKLKFSSCSKYFNAKHRKKQNRHI